MLDEIWQKHTAIRRNTQHVLVIVSLCQFHLTTYLGLVARVALEFCVYAHA